MLFVFYILVFLNINYAEISCFTLRHYELDKEINVTNATNIPDLFNRNNATTRHFFKMIQNLTSTKTIFSNLKSNVFDKMLSEEMLSIKEHLFEKDLSQVSLSLSTNPSASTPILEIKQKWPFVEYESLEDNRNKSIDQVINESRDEFNVDDIKTDNETDEEQNSNEKILGLRSLSGAHSHGTIQRTHIQRARKNSSRTVSKGVKLCTCTKVNIPSVPCTHRSDSSTCKCGVNAPKECTRIYQTISETMPVVYSYVTYPTYFVEISTYSPYKDYYYHPDVIDDMKLPKKHKKHKHRHKHKNRIDEESLYYDDSKEGFFKGYDDQIYDDDLPKKQPLTKVDDDKKVMINIDYEVRDEKGKIPKTTLPWENGYIENVIKEKLVNDMVKDLKQQYADAVLKDCYCAAFSLHTTNVAFYRMLFTVLILFWLFDKLY